MNQVSEVMIVAILMCAAISLFAVYGYPILSNNERIQPGDIVKCSDYEKIIDRYIVPGPEFHVVTIQSGYKLDRTLAKDYNYSDYQIGTYAQFPKNRAYIFEELNETETGYRNACKVIGYV